MRFTGMRPQFSLLHVLSLLRLPLAQGYTHYGAVVSRKPGGQRRRPSPATLSSTRTHWSAPHLTHCRFTPKRLLPLAGHCGTVETLPCPNQQFLCAYREAFNLSRVLDRLEQQFQVCPQGAARGSNAENSCQTNTDGGNRSCGDCFAAVNFAAGNFAEVAEKSVGNFADHL